MYCIQCGKKVLDHAKFCASCGAQINITKGVDGTDKNDSQRETNTPQGTTYKDDVFSKDTENLFSRFMAREYTPKDVDEFDTLTEKFVDYWENKFCKTKDQEDGTNLLNALTVAVKSKYDSNLFDQTRKLCEKILSTSKILYDQFGGTEYMGRVAWSYHLLGGMVTYGATLEERKEWLLKSLELYKEIQSKDQTVDERGSIASIYFSLGSIVSISDPDEGKNWYLKSIELLESMNYETGSLEEQRILIAGYRELSIVCLLKGSLDEAAIWNEKWMRLAEEVSLNSKSSEDWKEVFLAYESLGSVLFKEGHKSEAKMMYDKAVEGGEMLLRETNTEEAAHDLALLYMDYATMEEGHYDQAMLKKARKMLLQLTKKYPQTAQYAADLQSVNVKLKKRGR